MSETPSRIMVVDDEPANLKLLEETFKQKGYEVRSFPVGRLALASIARWMPDLILLDITMPELSGYEVCRRLKQEPSSAAIPVIFLSALQEADDKVKAFRAGGVDYIPKPFNFEEMYARVETHLQLHALRRNMQAVNERLEETVAARTRELAAAYTRLTALDGAKDDFLRIISHELRTPLQGLFGMGEIALDAMPQSDTSGNVRLVFERSRRRIVSLLDDALLLSRLHLEWEKIRAAPVSLSAALNRALERACEFSAARHVRVQLPTADAGMVQGEENLLASALHALLETAVKFSSEGETVKVAHEMSGSLDALRIFIESHGSTIPDAALGKFFDVFSISEAITPGGDLGLGPPVAARILSLFGGTVAVENLPAKGVRLTVEIPRLTE